MCLLAGCLPSNSGGVDGGVDGGSFPCLTAENHLADLSPQRPSEGQLPWTSSISPQWHQEVSGTPTGMCYTILWVGEVCKKRIIINSIPKAMQLVQLVVLQLA